MGAGASEVGHAPHPGRPPILVRLLASVRARLIGLTLIGAIPVAVLVGQSAVDLYREAGQAARERVALVREAAVARHQVVIDGAEQILTALARNDAVIAGDPNACDRALIEVLSLQGGRYSNIWVVDGAGRTRCSAIPAPRGESFAEAAWFRDAVQKNRFVLSELQVGPITQRNIVAAAQPVRRERDLVAVVGLGLSLDHLVLQTRPAARADTALWLMDDGGRSFPLTDTATEATLPVLSAWAALRRGTVTQVDAPSMGGEPYAYGAMSLGDDLRLVVGLASETYQAAARRAVIRRMIELGVLLVACLGAVAIGAHMSVIRPLRALSTAVASWRSRGGRFDPGPLRGAPTEVHALAQAMTAASTALGAREEELRAALASRDLLMAEIHHRVKNNLQIVASLLNLQAGRVRSAEARAAFGTARDRVRALATLHRHLYTHSDFETIALGTFLEELCGQLFEALGETPGERIALKVSAPDLTLGSDEAVPLALIITEAVTNAVKYAFPEDRSGTVSVTVSREGETLTLTVRDDGIGIDASQQNEETEPGGGLGKMLIDGFARQLGATLTTESSAAGTELRLTMAIRRRGRQTEPAQAAAAA
ncbi:histidine kinase dimerization/phosphoacceptor domain -containing protein [Elioraea tepidiphila]|uniref:sensor histidine kinase n=1 Tax=Elioraea tepidiphila TaxID=457934 RepID=UPI002FD92F75